MFRRCLQSVLHQRVPADRIEFHVVVIDNSNNAGERETVANASDGRVSIVYHHEPRLGIPVARNAALEAANALSSDWIVFIDDDEIAPPDWLGRLHDVALHFGADVIYGSVVQLESADEAQEGAKSWRVPDDFGAARSRKTASTSNVMFRPWFVREPLSLRFDECMPYGGSDTEFFMRAYQNGASITHVKDAVVFEEYPAERRTFVYEAKRAFRVGITTNYRYKKNLGSLRGTIAIAGRGAGNLARAILYGASSIIAFPFVRSAAERRMKQSVRAVCFVFGCFAPAFGIRMNRYW
jgi:succinoglycan biosynthesis protein ExoM